MMKDTICAALSALLLLSTTALSAQTTGTGEGLHSAVQVTFFPPLGTNGRHAAQYTNDFSFNLLAGVSKNEQAIALAGLTNVIRGNALGFQIAGLVNYTGGETCALQIAGLANVGCGDASGVQIAGLANVAKNVEGLQFGGLFNVARNVKGAQFAGILNIADSFRKTHSGKKNTLSKDVSLPNYNKPSSAGRSAYNTFFKD